MGGDPGREPVPDGPDQQVGVQAAEHPLDVLQLLVGFHRRTGAECVRGQAGADHVDSVQRGLGGDLVLILTPRQAIIGDVDDEVLGHLLGVDDLAHRQDDLVLAAQRPEQPRRGP